jgi:HEAT repeat protein
LRYAIVLLLGGLVFGACGDDPEPVLLPRLQGKDWRPAAREIAAMGPEAVPQLVSDLAVTSPHGEGSLQVSHVLLEMGDAALPPILEIARSGDAKERAAAVSLLGTLGGGFDGTLETIGAATRDRDSRVRWAAIFALHGHGRLGVPYLRERLSDEEMIRNTAAAMLMRLGERDDATMSAVRSILARGDDWGVLWRLEEMGPDGSWAVEDVARLALRSEKNLIHYARALGAIASAGDAGAVALEKRLAEGKKPGRDRLTQFTVAQALIAVDPQNPAARAFLSEALAEGSTSAAVSLWAAGVRDPGRREPARACGLLGRGPALHGLGDAGPAPGAAG